MSDEHEDKETTIKTLRSQRQRWCDDYWREAAELARLVHEQRVRTERMSEVFSDIERELVTDDELGYSHQSNNNVRSFLDRLFAAYNGPAETTDEALPTREE